MQIKTARYTIVMLNEHDNSISSRSLPTIELAKGFFTIVDNEALLYTILLLHSVLLYLQWPAYISHGKSLEQK